MVPATGEPGDAEAPNSVFSSRNDLQNVFKVGVEVFSRRRRLSQQGSSSSDGGYQAAHGTAAGEGSLTYLVAGVAQRGAKLAGGGAAPMQQLVQHPDPDPPQQSHRHHRQSQYRKALKLFWVHWTHFL